MAEAGACGTPVIGWKRGSIPEVVVEGKTGFIVDPEDGIAGLQRAVEKIDTIKPTDCREHIEKHFSLDVMVDNYVKLYEKLIAHHAG
jgi:glycosyltransferase involved in cell wall biosynthesis